MTKAREKSETTTRARADRDANGPSEWIPPFSPAGEILRDASPRGFQTGGRSHTNGYYGVPLLKRPVWGWQIATYFFFEGISAGAFVLGSLARLSGRKELEPLSRAANYVAFAALLPCPPMLIADLGRPERFHHMLRVWKPSSPMNLGAWTLLGYSVPVTAAAVGQFARDRGSGGPLARVGRAIPARLVDVAGLPLALTMISYPGVLLATTSTPVWSRTRLLGTVFASSSMSSAVAAMALAASAGGEARGARTLERLERVARPAEAIALGAYLATSGSAARPLVSGRYARLFWLGAVGAGLVLPALLPSEQSSGTKRRKGRWSTILKAGLKLAGAFALKWAVVHSGRASALDARAAREATQPSDSAPGWGRDREPPSRATAAD